MVTTRRQSKTIEPAALPPVAPPKRKRSNEAAPNAAQPPNQPSTRRRKKVKSTAKVDANPTPTEFAPAAPPTASPAKKDKQPLSLKAAERKARKQNAQRKSIVRPNTSGTDFVGSRLLPQVDLTDDNSGEDAAARQPQPAPSQDVEDEDADSRYALGSRRKGKAKKPAAPTARRTAELIFGEDGLEEVDKAEAAVAEANNKASAQNKKATPIPRPRVNNTTVARPDEGDTSKRKAKGKGKAKQKKTIPPVGVPSKSIMFTVVEAVATLSLYKDGTMSVPAEVDPLSRQSYEPLQTGECLSYPVKGTYHLGALGRYGIDTAPPLPFCLTVPLSQDSFIQAVQDTSTAEFSRHGLGFDSAFPTRPKPSSKARTNNYCFTFGRYRGRRMDSVSIEYLRTIFNGPEHRTDPKLQQAFTDLYPRGLYESEEERFTFQHGKHLGKRLDEVPSSYCWELLRKKQENDGAGLVGEVRSGRAKLERALEAWEKKQLDLTQD